jgi:hypothetical protein
MTADFYPFDMGFLGRVATRIINEAKGINRVVFPWRTRISLPSMPERRPAMAARSRACRRGRQAPGERQYRERCKGEPDGARNE